MYFHYCRRQYSPKKAFSSSEIVSGCSNSQCGMNIMRTSHNFTFYYIVCLVTLILYKRNIMPRWQSIDCAYSTAYRRGSTSCVPRPRKCISFVPRCLLHVYQLRPELSTPSMTNCVLLLVTNCISCVQTCLLYAYLFCPESSTARIWVASKGMGIHDQQFEGSYTVLSYFIHNYMHTYIIVEWYRQCTVFISCYCL